MPTSFERVVDAGCELAESAVWSVERRRFYFVDIPGKALHAFDPVTGSHAVDPVAENIGCVAPALDGGFIAGMRTGVWRLGEDGAALARLADNPEDTAWSRFNDGRIDPAGRLVVGTIDEGKQGRAALYRYDRRGLVRLADGLTTSNGLAWSPDGRTLYQSDTPRFEIYAWDYDPATGEADNRRVFARLDPNAPDKARPDGAAVDADGCYWSALWAGGRIRRFDPDGKVMADYPLPVSIPTMPAFGGPDLKTLYVTTARGPDGRGGDIYAMACDTAGLPSRPFDPAV